MHLNDVATDFKNRFTFHSVAGIPIASSDLQNAASKLVYLASRIGDRTGLSVHLVNAYTVALAHRDPLYASVLKESDINLPDGKPLTWLPMPAAARLRQVRGPSLFGEVLDLGRTMAIRHFLLGSSEETLSLLQQNLEARYPGIRIVGRYSPPYRPMNEAEVTAQDQQIRQSGADIVWVGLGTPKQDFEVRRLASSLRVMAVAVGAAFDFHAGAKREAPPWMRLAGLEWAFRFASEPRRLWKRYLLGNIVFLWAVLRRRPNL